MTFIHASFPAVNFSIPLTMISYLLLSHSSGDLAPVEIAFLQFSSVSIPNVLIPSLMGLSSG